MSVIRTMAKLFGLEDYMSAAAAAPFAAFGCATTAVGAKAGTTAQEVHDVSCPAGMVYIPEGTFRMGSTNGKPNEQPVRDIYVSSFCMDKHEVTNAEYSSDSLPFTDWLGESPPELFVGPNQPVVMVSWYKADAFCKKQGKRLPTEAEWEKAARGPGGFEYGTKSGRLNRDEARYEAGNTVDVCSYPENGYGLCDMAGNVWEWVSDWYDDDAYSSMESRDPQGPSGPSDGDYKVLRGGSWDVNILSGLRAAVRNGGRLGSDDTGFRCVADPVESEE